MTAPLDAPAATAGLDAIDVAAVKAKYREERDKRLRAEGLGQYQQVADGFEHMLRDPYAEEIVRGPVRAEPDAVVVGGGFGGLLAAARLREAGLADIRIIDRAGDFGGTWYWNRYPGAACDIESYIYLPMLEETGEIPVEKYSKAPEIFAHAKAIGVKYDLYRGALFQTLATSAVWDEERGRWIVTTDRGDVLAGKYVVLTNGSLDRPKLPRMPGLGIFKGHSFHTSRWDYDYTGGDWRGNLHRLADKRVGIIGTGATAVQVVPHLAAGAKHLYVFQRTPSTIGVRANKPTDYDWAKTLQPGWQKRRMENFNNLVSISDVDEPEDLVDDGWTDVIRRVLLIRRQLQAEGRPAAEAHKLSELADIQQMDAIRARVDEIVRDAATAEALKPYYAYFCKRPCFHDEYLQSFNQPNVTLVDTAGKGVEAMTERGIVAGGKEYELDCLIWATGFDYGAGPKSRGVKDIRGRGGLTLDEKWADGGATFQGLQIGGFPNLFIFHRVQTGVTTNITHMLRELARHAAYIVAEAEARGAAVVDVDPEAEAEWVAHAESKAILRKRFFEECTPGYYNDEGQVRANARNAPYGAGPGAFIRVLEAWREAGGLAGLKFETR